MFIVKIDWTLSWGLNNIPYIPYLLDHTPPRINAPPPSSGAKLLRRVFISCVRLLDRARDTRYTCMRLKLRSSIILQQHHVKQHEKDIHMYLEGKEVDNLSLSDYLHVRNLWKYGGQLLR